MLENLNLENLLVFDIETVPQTDDFNNLPDHFKQMWEHKVRKLMKEEDVLAENYYGRAGIYAEFGKVVCISAGYFKKENGALKFRVKSFAHDDQGI